MQVRMSVHRASDGKRRQPDRSTIHDQGVSSPDSSVVRAELNGEHEGPPNRRSTTTYVVIAGHMTVTLDGRVEKLGPGDIVVCAPNTRRTLQGQASLVIISTPGFDPRDEG
jgi:quercetin dioxygenase-like cupin family protein